MIIVWMALFRGPQEHIALDAKKILPLSSTWPILLASLAIYSCIPPSGHPIIYNYFRLSCGRLWVCVTAHTKVHHKNGTNRLSCGRLWVCATAHTKVHHKNGTNCLPAWHAGVMVRVGV